MKGQCWGPRPNNARNEAIQQSIKEANTHNVHLKSIIESQQTTNGARRLTCQEASTNME